MPLRFTKTNQQELLALGSEWTGSAGFGPDAVAFGAYQGEAPVCVAVFERFAGGCADIHLGAAPGRTLPREAMVGLATLACHPRMLGLRRVYAHIPATNPRAQAAAIKAGWEVEARIRAGGMDGVDVVLLSLGSEKVSGLLSQVKRTGAES